LTKIILIRHGQGENNLHSLIGGWSDLSLTELGVQQAQAVADRLNEELTEDYKFYSSDLVRAKQTAEIICETLSKTPQFVVELREHNPGIVSGMHVEEAKKLLQDVSEPSLEWRPFPEAENAGEFYARVSSYMDKLVEREERVVIVSHGGTIQNIIRWWIGSPLPDYYRVGFGVANTSVTVLDSTENRERRIERLNDTAHYARIGNIHPIP
jgi:broad specificity phosphatase PhoE